MDYYNMNIVVLKLILVLFYLLSRLDLVSPQAQTAVSNNESQTTLSCQCPIGFQLVQNTTDCSCECDSRLFPEYVSQCFIENQTVLRKGNVWIFYINTSDEGEGFIIYPNCPFDYCRPPSEPVYINFNVLFGEDSQCAFNRTGVLCGACEEGLSLTLGSTSRCRSCSNVSLLLLIVFIVAGIALVVFLLACKLTLSKGTIFSLIFYANLIQANRHVFLPFVTPNFFSVFIAWISLDFGFETCFYDGMDAYSKTWLQFVFPIYLVGLVALILIIQRCSKHFSQLVDKCYLVPVMATLLLLSYAKALRIIIPIFSFARLEYPDGSHETRWLVDGTVRYLEGKHIPLFLVGLLLILVGLVCTIHLLFWQCFEHLKCCLKWTLRLRQWSVALLNPFEPKAHFWLGLLLLAWLVLYVVIMFLYSFNLPFASLVAICWVGLVLLVLKENNKVYRQKLPDLLENFFILNLLITSIFLLYFGEESAGQVVIPFIIAFIVFFAIVVYHVYRYRLKKYLDKCMRKHSGKMEVSAGADGPGIDGESDDNEAAGGGCVEWIRSGRKRNVMSGLTESQRVALESRTRPLLANRQLEEEPLNSVVMEEENESEQTQ